MKGLLEFRRSTGHLVPSWPVICICTPKSGDAGKIKWWEQDSIHPSPRSKAWKVSLSPSGVDQTQDTLRCYSVSRCSTCSGNLTPALLCHYTPWLTYRKNYLRSSGVMYFKKVSCISVALGQMKKWLPVHWPVYGINTQWTSENAADVGRLLPSGERRGQRIGKFYVFLNSCICCRFLPGSIFKSRILCGCNQNAYRYIILNKPFTFE